MLFFSTKIESYDDRPTLKNEVKAYYEYLQTHLPDPRDNRGKRHDLAFVLTSLLWALLRSGGQLSVSRLHLWLVREHEWLVEQVGAVSGKAISHSQLRRILAVLDYTRYNALTRTFFGWSE